jgi:hypothetical protein
MPSKQSGYGVESVRERKKKMRIRCVYSLPGGLVAISKMNVPLGTGGRVPWQSVAKWTRKTGNAANLCVKGNGGRSNESEEKRAVSEIRPITQINKS